MENIKDLLEIPEDHLTSNLNEVEDLATLLRIKNRIKDFEEAPNLKDLIWEYDRAIDRKLSNQEFDIYGQDHQLKKEKSGELPNKIKSWDSLDDQDSNSEADEPRSINVNQFINITTMNEMLGGEVVDQLSKGFTNMAPGKTFEELDGEFSTANNQLTDQLNNYFFIGTFLYSADIILLNEILEVCLATFKFGEIYFRSCK